VRYPEGKEAITGYRYEPWHLRYVGVEISKEIAANNSTLENYLNAVPVVK
jgi:D-alanyl-D-alanine carboxypeptidase